MISEEAVACAKDNACGVKAVATLGVLGLLGGLKKHLAVPGILLDLFALSIAYRSSVRFM
jgi:hypothetical protein